MPNPWMIIAAGVIATGVFFAGWYSHSRFVMADLLEAANDKHDAYVEQVKTEREENQKIADALHAQIAKLQETSNEVEVRIVEVAKANEFTPTIGLVSLWNHAIRGEPLSSTPTVTLNSSELPAGITNTQFIHAALHCVREYNGVKLRYNTLVDWHRKQISRTQAD